MDQVIEDTGPPSGQMVTFRTAELYPRRPSLRMWGLPRNKKRVIELARSIQKDGIREAITVIWKNGRAEIEDGEARWIAAKLLEGDDSWQILGGVKDPEIRRLCGSVSKNSIIIPAIPTVLDDITRLRETVTHNQYHDLEMARIIHIFREAKYNQTQIAEILGGEGEGWSQTLVSHIYRLRSLSPRLHWLLAKDMIRTAVVVKALRTYGVRTEEFVLGAISDLKAEAAIRAVEAEAEARHLWAEVERLIAAGNDSMIEPAPGKRKVARVEWTQNNASAASVRADEAKKVRDYGPDRITWNDVENAAIRRASAPQRLPKAAVQEFVEAVQREAGASTCPETRQRLNLLLVKHGFPRISAHVGTPEQEQWQDQEQSATAA